MARVKNVKYDMLVFGLNTRNPQIKTRLIQYTLAAGSVLVDISIFPYCTYYRY
jgi:hypothetical protein